MDLIKENRMNNVLLRSKNAQYIPFYGKLSITFTDDEFGEKTVSILLDGEESEMVFIDHPSIEMSVSICTICLRTKGNCLHLLIFKKIRSCTLYFVLFFICV